MIANYHTHTYRCGHAVGSDRDYVDAALKGGLQTLGFSDHTPFPIPGDGTGMMMEELDGYVKDLQALKREYAGQIDIYIGLEVENSPAQFQALTDALRQYPLDYLILGQHTIFGHADYRKPYNPTSDPAHFNTYCEQAAQGIQSGIFTYWAHPDVINFTGDSELYEHRMRSLCRLAKKHGLPLEINLHGARDGRNYPNPNFWRIASEEGCDAILACDAHEPCELYDRAKAMAVVKPIIDQFHLHVLDTVTLRKP